MIDEHKQGFTCFFLSILGYDFYQQRWTLVPAAMLFCCQKVELSGDVYSTVVVVSQEKVGRRFERSDNREIFHV